MVEGDWLWITWERMVFGYLVLMQLWEGSSINVWYVENRVESLVTRKCQIYQKEALFTHCGVDMFGPFIIRERRSSRKRYCALFTCFASRAVHIEEICTMEIDSFIQTLCRFMARQGMVRSIRSDNGANFVGTDNNFERLWRKWIKNR